MGDQIAEESVLSPLSRDDIEEIHSASLKILEEVGIKIFDEESLRLLDEAGADVDYRVKTSRIPSALTSEMIRKAPRRYMLFGREREFDLRVGGGETYFATGNAADIVEDRGSRRIKREDLAVYIRLADVLGNVHFCVGTSVADVPQAIWDIYQFDIMVNNTVKNLRPVIASGRGAEIILKMACAVVGDDEALMKKPILHFGYSVTSPLQWGTTALQVFRETSRYNIPVDIVSEPMSGGTSPVTLAGTIALANAEVLSGIVLNQLYRRGRPCTYSIGFAHTMDLKSAQPLSAGPEQGLIAAAGAQMAHYYSLPSQSWIGSDSKLVDVQLAYEKTLGIMLHLLSGNDKIWGVGSLDLEFSISLEQAVIDNEIIDMVTRLKRGITVNEETLALDVIKRVDIGGMFLKEKHSRDHYLQEHVQAKIIDHYSRRKWERMGSKDMVMRAKERVDELVKSHESKPLDRDIRKNLKEIIKQVKKGL